MRLTNLYQLYDTRAKTTIGPIFTNHNEVGVARELRDHANNKETIIGKAPEDFCLLHLGIQDQDTGTVDAMERPAVIFYCDSLVAKPEGPQLAIASE